MNRVRLGDVPIGFYNAGAEVENPLLNPNTSPEEIVPSPLSLSVNMMRLPPLSSELSSSTIGRSSSSSRIAQQQAS
jgi:hypothetical protein